MPYQGSSLPLPTFKVIPLSPTTVLNFLGKLLISSINPACGLSLTSDLEALGSPNLRFSEIDVNKNASWGTIEIFFLSSSNLIFFISILSKNNWPSGISMVLPRDFANVVLPQPTGPTIAISSPGLILKLRLFNELNFDPGYFIVKSFASKILLLFLLKNLYLHYLQY